MEGVRPLDTAGAAEALVSCRGDSFAISCEIAEDLVGGLDPEVGTRVFVPVVEPGADVAFELGDAAVDAAAEHLGGDLGEPALDEVEPGGALRDEVEHKARVADEPALDRWRLVGGVIVEDQMQLEPGRRLALELVEELLELERAVAGVQAADHLPAREIK